MEEKEKNGHKALTSCKTLAKFFEPEEPKFYPKALLSAYMDTDSHSWHFKIEWKPQWRPKANSNTSPQVFLNYCCADFL